MVPSPFEINFSPSSIPATECATITILDDLQLEGDQEFEVEITDTSNENVEIGTQSTTTVMIMDNDGGFYRDCNSSICQLYICVIHKSYPMGTR